MTESSNNTVLSAVLQARHYVERVRYIGPLLIRIAVGVMFAQSGWGKLTHLDRTTNFFQSLGVPAPELNAIVVANVEFLGGIALAIGLLTRLWSVPLAATMVVAIFTALLPDVEGVIDFITLDETLYLAALVYFITNGPGALSLDHFIGRWLGRKNQSSTSPGAPLSEARTI